MTNLRPSASPAPAIWVRPREAGSVVLQVRDTGHGRAGGLRRPGSVAVQLSGHLAGHAGRPEPHQHPGRRAGHGEPGRLSLHGHRGRGPGLTPRSSPRDHRGAPARLGRDAPDGAGRRLRPGGHRTHPHRRGERGGKRACARPAHTLVLARTPRDGYGRAAPGSLHGTGDLRASRPSSGQQLRRIRLADHLVRAGCHHFVRGRPRLRGDTQPGARRGPPRSRTRERGRLLLAQDLSWPARSGTTTPSTSLSASPT